MARKKEFHIGQQLIVFEYETAGTFTKKLVKLNDMSFLALVGALSKFDIGFAAKLSVEENVDYDQLIYHGLRLYEEVLEIKDTVYGPNGTLAVPLARKEQLQKREAARKRKYIRTQYGVTKVRTKQD